MKAERRDTLTFVAVAFASIALMSGLFAVGLSDRAVSEAQGTRASSTGGGGESGHNMVDVTLTEFAIEPGDISIQGGTGAMLNIKNEGSTEHDVQVEGTDLVSDKIAGGSSGMFDISSLAPGKYTIFCDIPGHKEAGMKANLTVTEGGGDAGGGETHAASSGSMSWQKMDDLMAGRTKAFPQSTKGEGGKPLEPKTLSDGTKQFTLTAKIVDWEIEKGKTVKAWTYNGTVPGPTMRVNTGDRVAIVLKNELPESTALHMHGIRIPNSMDGVPDITQDPIRPGKAFTYSFTAKGPSVGMYHSHHNAAKQVANGMAGALYVDDMPKPNGIVSSQRIPMMLNDSGTIGFSLNGKSFPATKPISAKLGEWVELDYLNEGVQAHPMHLHGLDQLVFAKDGYPLASPYYADTVNVAPGERYSVLVKADVAGIWAFHCHILPHAEKEDGMFGMVTAMIVK